MSPREFPRIFGYDLQAIKYSISVPLDRGGFGGWNLMLTLQKMIPKKISARGSVAPGRRAGQEEMTEIRVVSG